MTAPSPSAAHRPLASLVVPCYGVEEYLPAFIRALDRQLNSRVEVIFVIDGSPDNSGDIARNWRDRSAHQITVIEQVNGGLSSARNTGLKAARGEWVSFPDPDDILERGYLHSVLGFLDSTQANRASIAITNIVTFRDGGARTNAHPLRWKFSKGNRIVRLAEEAEHVQLSAATTFLRLDTIREHGLLFDGRIKPTFEDAVFIAQYLLKDPDPSIGVLADALYLYRGRADASSLVQSSWTRPEKYDDQMRYGYLGLLTSADELGPVPVWVQNVILYDLNWYFELDGRMHTPTAALSPEQIAVFQELLGRILSFIEAHTLETYHASRMSRNTRDWLRARKGALPATPVIRPTRYDAEQQLTRVVYTIDADASLNLRFTIGGVPVEPAYSKRRAVTFFGHTAMHEVITWLPGTGTIAATLHGESLPVAHGEFYGVPSVPRVHSSRNAAVLDAARNALNYLVTDRRLFATIAAGALRRVLRRTPIPDLGKRMLSLRGSEFENCWLLIDRDTQAQDNAEHLYRYLKKARPDINAWFVLNETSPDWRRLSDEGFRLLAHGSARHMIALTHCRELISSQIDHYILYPTKLEWQHPKPWRFTWLQHGVTKDDISRWVNRKPTTTAIAATPQEAKAFTADGTPSVWTERELKLTGFPRHDALIALDRNVPLNARRSILLMPTWRQGLLGDTIAGGNLRELRDGFWDSTYIRNWFGLLRSPLVRSAAEAAGLDLVLLPHPNMAPHITPERMPDGVRLANYATDDFQQVLAHASHVLTDYSSNAFEAALIERPILYFQFDLDEFWAGDHVYRKGYFDYEADGFGPVCYTLETAEATLVEMISQGKYPQEPYATRITETFPLRDGHSCARIVQAIESHRLPWNSEGPMLAA